MHQPIPAAPCHTPHPGLTPEHQHFFCLGCQVPGGGDSRTVNSPGWGIKKRANAPSSVNTATLFIAVIQLHVCKTRAIQNQRLTNTLLFVSIFPLLTWLPLIIVNYFYSLEIVPMSLIMHYIFNY